MKNVFVQAIAKLKALFMNTALCAAGTTDISAVAAPAVRTMDDIDMESPKMKAAMLIVNTMNSSYNKGQLDTVSRMIDLFERQYGNSLPLRAWWQNAAYCVTLWPKNASVNNQSQISTKCQD